MPSRCISEGCAKQPSCNIEGSKALYCSVHRFEGMINVISKRCASEGCKTQPSCNVEGSKEALYCSVHKLEGMINIVSKRCASDECKTRPIYNVEGSKDALYCSVHKFEGMINVKNKRCASDECKTRPSYNVEGSKEALYCSVHKFEGMVDVKSKRCASDECKTQPIYNVEGSKEALHCSVHKLEGMIDVKNKRCKSDWCYTFISKKYEGYCLFCYMHLFPDKPTVRNYKTKESSVVEFVKSSFPNVKWVTDKKVQDGCSRRRPDMLLDLGYQVLIIEVDENQHTEYDCSCENRRTMELSKDVNHRPIVFIRFNPDDYMVKDETVKSCWSVNKLGICVVKKSKKDEWDARLDTLRAQIEYWSNPDNTTIKTVEVVELFYDK